MTIPLLEDRGWPNSDMNALATFALTTRDIGPFDTAVERFRKYLELLLCEPDARGGK